MNQTTTVSTNNLSQKSPIIVAIDKPSLTEALKIADMLDPKYCRVKVGKELFTRCGPEVIKKIHKMGFDVFLDLKFHDIPNTTAQAVLAAADMGVWMVNVHANCGLEAMQTTKQRLMDAGHSTLLIAVTVLTSMTQQGLKQLGVNSSIDEQVKRLALLTNRAGLDGVVCSAQEAKMLKSLCGDNFKLVTPGIRTLSDASNDQKRICTPEQAIENGADYLVIGRSITNADSPTKKLMNILDSINI